MRTGDTKDDTPILEATVEHVKRGQIGAATNANDDAYFNNIVVEAYSPNGAQNQISRDVDFS